MAKSLVLPADAETIRALRAGDDVLVSGRVVTAREAAHRHLVRGPDPTLARLVAGCAIYHCGPVVAQDPSTRSWRFVAAGPTASLRMEPYQAEVLSLYGPRAVIGKGGMGAGTLAALERHGAVYLHAAGGLAVTLARRVVRVRGVHLLDELGVTEAIWDIDVEALPAVVTMDAHGDSLHARSAHGAEELTGDP